MKAFCLLFTIFHLWPSNIISRTWTYSPSGKVVFSKHGEAPPEETKPVSVPTGRSTTVTLPRTKKPEYLLQLTDKYCDACRFWFVRVDADIYYNVQKGQDYTEEEPPPKWPFIEEE